MKPNGYVPKKESHVALFVPVIKFLKNDIQGVLYVFSPKSKEVLCGKPENPVTCICDGTSHKKC